MEVADLNVAISTTTAVEIESAEASLIAMPDSEPCDISDLELRRNA
jgi:hypothetical protein